MLVLDENAAPVLAEEAEPLALWRSARELAHSGTSQPGVEVVIQRWHDRGVAANAQFLRGLFTSFCGYISSVSSSFS